MKYIKFYLFLLFPFLSYSQCPPGVYILPDSICPEETAIINNSNSNAVYFNWDYCPGDLNNIPAGAVVPGLSGSLNYPQQIHIVHENGEYSAFITNAGINYLTRYDFGNSLDNVPLVTNLTPDPLLSGFATGIDMVKEGNKWIAFITCFTSNKLLKIEFDSLKQVNPAITDLGLTGLAQPVTVRIYKDYVFVTNNQNADLLRYSFGGSYFNIPTAITPINTGFFGSSGFDIAYDCNAGKETGFLTNGSLGLILRFDFGNDLASNPIITTEFSNVYSLQGLRLINEKSSWHLFTVGNNKLYHFETGNTLYNPLSLTYDNNFNNIMSEPKDIELVRINSEWRGIIPNNLLFACVKATFPEVLCNAVISSSTNQSPANLVYQANTNGYQHFELTETNANGELITYHDSILVELRPPEAMFSHSPACINTPVQFSDESSVCSGTILSYHWDFGDGNTSVDMSPIHTYNLTGTYTVELSIVSSSNDSGTYTTTVNVSDVPIANYSFSDSICEGSIMNFTDLSVPVNGIITEWMWDFGDSTTDSLQSPAHIYYTAGNFVVNLQVTNSSGCSAEITDTVSVLPVPQAGFTVSGTCIGEITEFTNTSLFPNNSVFGYQWNFGDGNTDVVSDPQHNYVPTSANYNVTLTAIGQNGCIDSISKNIRISEKPHPWFNISRDTACAGNLILFTDSSITTGIDTIISYIWDFGDNSTDSINKNPGHIYVTPGIYTVTLTVISATYCDTSVSRTIEVIESPQVSFGYHNVCQGTDVPFIDQSITPIGTTITSYEWNFGDGNTDTIANPVHNYLLPGIYNVLLTVTSSQGCIDSISQTVNIYEVPVASFGYSAPCTGLPVFFTDSSVTISDSITTWSWTFGSIGAVDSIPDPQFSFSDNSAEPVTLIVGTSNGCFDTITRYLIINQSPEFNSSGNNTCFGNNTLFQYLPLAGSSTNVNILWNFGDSTASNADNPVHNYNSAGVYVVILTVTDLGNSCYASDTLQINVYPSPDVKFSGDSGCVGVPINFMDMSTVSGGQITDWKWIFENSSISLLQNPTYQFNQPGVVPVQLITTTDAGCTDSLMKFISIHELTQVDFTPSPLSGPPPLEVSFSNFSDPGYYIWNFNDNSPLDTSTSPFHIFTDTGYYQVQLTVTDYSGCSDSLSKTIRVLTPYNDLSVENAAFNASGGWYTMSARIRNRGNEIASSYSLIADLEGASIISESFTYDTISPGSEKNIVFKTKLASEGQSPKYFCVRIESVNNGADQYQLNNEICKTFTDKFTIYYLHADAENGIVNFNLNVPDADDLEINLYSAEGKYVKPPFKLKVHKGYQSVNTDISQLASGVYSISIKYRGDYYSARFLIPTR